MKVPRLLVTIALLMLLDSQLSAQNNAVPRAKPVNPNGTWVWEQRFGGNAISYELRLRFEDDKLSGTYKQIFGNTGNAPPRVSEPVEILNPTLSGDEISFSVIREFGGNEFTTSFDGVFVGDKLGGFTETDFGGQIRESEWFANRAVAVDDIAGKWNVTLETPQGDVTEAFTIVSDQENDSLSGTFHSSVFGESPLRDVALDGTQLTFVVELRSDNGVIAAKYAAEPRVDSISGLISVTINNEEMEIPFTGSREQIAAIPTKVEEPAESKPRPSESNAADLGAGKREQPAPGRVPSPGPVTDGPYLPQPILPGGIVMPLYPPDSPMLKQDRIGEAEQYNMTKGVPGRIQSIVNIHNPSIEVHTVEASINTGTCVILAAGGGHRTLNVGTEAGDFVPYFYNYGVNTVILRNRLRQDGYVAETDAVNDALQAIRLVRANAASWGISPDRIGIIGFSAGAELSGPAAIRFADFDKEHESDDSPLSGVSSRPDFVGLLYPGPTPFTRDPETPVPRNAPPSFVATPGSGDQIHAIWAMDYFNAMLRAGIPNIEMHVYGNGVHAGGLKDRAGTPFGTWQDRYIDWFRDLGFLSKPDQPTKAAADSKAFVETPPRDRRSAKRRGSGR